MAVRAPPPDADGGAQSDDAARYRGLARAGPAQGIAASQEDGKRPMTGPVYLYTFGGDAGPYRVRFDHQPAGRAVQIVR